jgi:hypothetical protein
MPLPDRPVDGAEIATDWGQAIHDYTFAPKGCISSGTGATCSTTATNLPIDAAVEDPGGWVDIVNNKLVAPTGAEGLYTLMANFNGFNGTAGDNMRGIVLLNGSQYATAVAVGDGGTHVVWNVVALVSISAGDVITFQGQKRGSGTNPSIALDAVALVRIGAELGA